jgi:G3E family GTPase
MEGRPGRVWQPGELRRNELVFIGRKLDASALKKGFKTCLDSADLALSVAS